MTLPQHGRHCRDSESDNDTPFLTDIAVSSFIANGIGLLIIDASQLTLFSVDCWLIYEQRSWDTETRFYGNALMGKRSVNFLICWLLDQYINREAGPSNGHKSTVTGTGGVDFKSQTSIFTYRLINQSIYISIEVQNRGRGESVGQNTAGRIDRTDRKYLPTGRTVAITDRT